jgi:hypothetical protein
MLTQQPLAIDKLRREACEMNTRSANMRQHLQGLGVAVVAAGVSAVGIGIEIGEVRGIGGGVRGVGGIGGVGGVGGVG